MNYCISALLGLMFITSCSNSEIESSTTISLKKTKRQYPHDLGDIAHDPSLDKDLFVLCDSTRTIQGRSNLLYPGGVEAIEKICLSQFEYNPTFEGYTGYVTIRFMINCENETGRFRAHTLNLDFSPNECPDELKDQLLAITRNLKGWEKSTSFPPTTEYSKYINFKIDHGKLEHALM